MTARARSTEGELRLRWWAVALPIACFAALLTLLASAQESTAATVGTDPVSRLVEYVHTSLR
ncbi:hypothetical protein SAMN06297387_10115 [Streptomyces zhaozhouensis]|uniref:Uncharacterized protein n=1 Tax=Streptomyces zhaozhouensis TaxID=1300267 RepID=A0A286DHD7_9ACTN|nr:hypothetical protein [Streptomyces zhaozhouensis]SOD58167.1 hypothetical protein SAMN06297387_10115 [Streptomyces zhaozhouensis]